MQNNQGELLKKIEAINEISTTPLDYLFVGNATAKLLEYLVKSKEFDFSLSDIIRGAEVSSKTIERDIPKLEKYGIIEHTKIIGRSKMYRVNNENPIVQNLSKFMLSLATVRNYYELKNQGYSEQAEKLIEGKGYFPSSK